MVRTSYSKRSANGNPSRSRQRVKTRKTISMTESLDERLQAMIQEGTLTWSGKKLKPVVPVERASGKRTVAGLLIENRR